VRSPARAAVRAWAVDLLRRRAWAPLSVLGLHLFLSRVAGAYRALPDLDLPVHLLGGVAFSWFALGAAEGLARRGLLGGPNRLALLGAAFLATASAALFWEFAEFLSDRWLGTRAQGGLDDTLLDMAMGVAGSLLHLGGEAARRRPA